MARSVNFKLFLEVMIGTYIARLDFTLPKDDHWGTLAVCCRLWGAPEDKLGKGAGRLSGACQQVEGETCNNMDKNLTASRVTFLELEK